MADPERRIRVPRFPSPVIIGPAVMARPVGRERLGMRGGSSRHELALALEELLQEASAMQLKVKQSRKNAFELSWYQRSVVPLRMDFAP